MDPETSSNVAFSTDSNSKGDRVTTFCECMCQNIVHLTVVAHAVAAFRGQLRIRHAGSMGIAELASTPADYLRETRLADDENDDLLVVLWRAGRANAIQDQLESGLAPGEGVVLDNSKEWQLHVLEDSEYWALQIPKRRIRRLIPGVDDVAGTKLRGSGGALRLLLGYLEGTRAHDLDDKQTAALFGDHLADLAALVLDAKGEGRRPAERGGARAAQLAKILREIERRNAEPDLSATAIAMQFAVSPRYVHRLLERTGRSFSQHVLEKRLDQAATLLRDVSRRNHKIAEIALEAGFSDLSHFHRVFRRRFGDTPSGFRASEMRRLNGE